MSHRISHGLLLLIPSFQIYSESSPFFPPLLLPPWPSPHHLLPGLPCKAPDGSVCTRESDRVLPLLKTLQRRPVSWLILQAASSSGTPGLSCPALTVLSLTTLITSNLLQRVTCCVHSSSPSVNVLSRGAILGGGERLACKKKKTREHYVESRERRG